MGHELELVGLRQFLETDVALKGSTASVLGLVTDLVGFFRTSSPELLV